MTTITQLPSGGPARAGDLLPIDRGPNTYNVPIESIQNFLVSVTDTTPGANVNNYSPPGYVGGKTNRIVVTATSGGTTLTGLSSTGVTDGWSIIIFNPSITDSINFINNSSLSAGANRFACPGNVDALLGPQTAAFVNYIGNQWVFA